jgi:hypothetical protein
LAGTRIEIESSGGVFNRNDDRNGIIVDVVEIVWGEVRDRWLCLKEPSSRLKPEFPYNSEEGIADEQIYETIAC